VTKTLFLLFCAAILTACSPPRVRTTTLVPSDYHDAARLRHLAVLTIDGRGGSAFTAEIEAALAAVEADGRQYFTLFERSRLDRILDEQDLDPDRLDQPDTLAGIGRLAGVTGMVGGKVTRALTDTPYREKHTICLEHEAPPQHAKKSEGKCIRSEQRSVPCTKRELILSFTPKIIDVASARIVYTRTLRATGTDTVCRDSDRPLTSEAVLYGQARESVLATFTKDIAPHYETFVFNLMDEDEGISSPEALKQFEAGLDFARKNRLDRACELWQSAAPLAPEAPALRYNLGVCAEIDGELGKARELYQQADRLLSEPHDDISRALRRINAALANRRQLDEQME